MNAQTITRTRATDILDDPQTFEVALFAYFGMSDNAILGSMRGMTKGKIAYRLNKARKRFNVSVKRADYRDGRNNLARRVITQLRPWSEKQLALEYLK